MTEQDTWRGLGRMPDRRLPYQLVAYGFVGKGPNNNWVVGPANVFRPTYLFVWGKGARLSSFNVAGEEQLVYDPGELVPVDVIEPAIPPSTVLELTRLRLSPDEARLRELGKKPLVLIGEPLSMSPPVDCNGPYPTCSPGEQIRLEWQGELEALLIVGPQIL